VKRPVHSSTTSTPRSFHGSLAGSFSLRTWIFVSPIASCSPSAATFSSHTPWIESKRNRCASVLASVRSLTATKVTSFMPRRRAARTTRRPMRPKPFTPTRMLMISLPRSLALQRLHHLVEAPVHRLERGHALGEGNRNDLRAAQRHHLAEAARSDEIRGRESEPAAQHAVEGARRSAALHVPEHDRARLGAGRLF